jgi:hypothetical protein
MVRPKPAKPKKKTPGKWKGLVPCLVLVVSALILVNLLFYVMLRSSTP